MPRRVSAHSRVHELETRERDLAVLAGDSSTSSGRLRAPCCCCTPLTSFRPCRALHLSARRRPVGGGLRKGGVTEVVLGATDVSGWPRSSGHQGVAGCIGSIGFMGFIGFMGSIMVLAGMVNRFVHCDRGSTDRANAGQNSRDA